MSRPLLLLLALTACQAAPVDKGDTDVDSDSAVSQAPFSLPDVVQTSVGPIEGYRRSGSAPYVGFVGVPYAEAPTGDLRFKPPQRRTWTETFDASEPPALTSPKCPQRLPVVGSVVDEDCLRLNVHVPDPVTPGTPVLVWLHGGGFTVGEGLQAGGGSSGHVLAGQGDVIVVSVNYRLGALGWLSHAALADQTAGVPAGNYGYLDVLGALSWIHENIATFGGDPGKVTVAGQSAGGALVCMLLADPDTEDLFQRAIVQSADCSLSRRPAGAQAEAEAWLADVGCDDAPDVASCVRAVPASEIVKLQFGDSQGQTLGARSWGPVVDGDVVPDDPAVVFARGGHRTDVPVVWGFTAEEGTAGVVTGGGTPLDDDDEAWRAHLATRFGRDDVRVDAVLAAYPLADFRDRFAPLDEVELSAATWAAAVLTGDEETACPTRRAVATLAAHGDVYAYVFRYPDATWPLEGRGYGAFHFADVQYLFGIHPEFLFSKTFEPEEVVLHEAIRDRWLAFAATGDPGGDWPAYAPDADAWLSLDRTVEVVGGPKEGACAALEAARGD